MRRWKDMRILLTVTFLIGLLTAAMVSPGDAQVNISIGGPGFYTAYRFYQPMVLKWRIVIVMVEGGCTTLQYFTASGIDGQPYQFLGDEVYCNGRKMKDSYAENDRE